MPFRLNHQYAERFGDVWVVLSADYGLIPPDLSIPDLYGVSFKRGPSRGLPQRPSPVPKRRHHLRRTAARPNLAVPPIGKPLP
jgi:hypothetical protein